METDANAKKGSERKEELMEASDTVDIDNAPLSLAVSMRTTRKQSTMAAATTTAQTARASITTSTLKRRTTIAPDFNLSAIADVASQPQSARVSISRPSRNQPSLSIPLPLLDEAIDNNNDLAPWVQPLHDLSSTDPSSESKILNPYPDTSSNQNQSQNPTFNSSQFDSTVHGNLNNLDKLSATSASLQMENKQAVPIHLLNPEHFEQLISKFGSNPLANISTSVLETPSPFGASDFALIIDASIRACAEEMGVPILDVVAAHVPGAPVSNKTTQIQTFQGLTPAQMNLKLKTTAFANAELGRKLNQANNCIGDLRGRIAHSEGEKAAALLCCARLKKDMEALELRCRTAEGAINAYNHAVKLASFTHEMENDVAEATSFHVVETGTDVNVPVDEELCEIIRQEQLQQSIPVQIPKIIPIALNDLIPQPQQTSPKNKNYNTQKLQKSKHLRDAIFSNNDNFSSEPEDLNIEGYGSDRSPKITRSVINNTAEILAAKKNFDPPTTLLVGLKSSIKKEQQLCNEHTPTNPITARTVPINLTKPQASAYHSTNIVSRLTTAYAIDPTNHISSVLAAQTQSLLTSATPAEYLQKLHTQLEDMTRALYVCVDTLAEERRVREAWRAKWEKASWRLKTELGRQKRQTEEREGGSVGGIGIGMRYRECYRVNGMEPINGVKSAVDTFTGFLESGNTGSRIRENGAAGNGLLEQKQIEVKFGNEKKQRLVQTAPDFRQRLISKVENRLSNHGIISDNFTEKLETRSQSAATTNRPKYKSFADILPSSPPPTANFQLNPQTKSISQKTTPQTHVEIENDRCIDSRLVDITSSESSVSTFSINGAKKIGVSMMKTSYAIPTVSAITPFDNPLIKRRFRKPSSDAKNNNHWSTSNVIA
ncbi:hypothetical protein HK100_011568 [Physocladia obscura]|uniref:Uncharacterized protein n=1 Tax=Physocladia obscura TaxID=109957 RepID=A0AAD5T9F1_9FUNG|nr:hypothetical protein HK100_011568 [Physocladia obscura]